MWVVESKKANDCDEWEPMPYMQVYPKEDECWEYINKLVRLTTEGWPYVNRAAGHIRKALA